MPCRDYEADTFSVDLSRLRKQNDRLARIACKAMDALEQNGEIMFLLLKDDEVREWYEKHKEEDRTRAAEEERKRRDAIKRDLLECLTPDEKKALGIKV